MVKGLGEQSTAPAVAVAQADVGCRLQRDEFLENVSLVSPGTKSSGKMTQNVLKIHSEKPWNVLETQRNVRNGLETSETGLKGHTEPV